MVDGFICGRGAAGRRARPELVTTRAVTRLSRCELCVAVADSVSRRGLHLQDPFEKKRGEKTLKTRVVDDDACLGTGSTPASALSLLRPRPLCCVRPSLRVTALSSLVEVSCCSLPALPPRPSPERLLHRARPSLVALGRAWSPAEHTPFQRRLRHPHTLHKTQQHLRHRARGPRRPHCRQRLPPVLDRCNPRVPRTFPASPSIVRLVRVSRACTYTP